MSHSGMFFICAGAGMFAYLTGTVTSDTVFDGVYFSGVALFLHWLSNTRSLARAIGKT